MEVEQKKEIVNGLQYNYLCHLHNVDNYGNVFPAHYHNYIEILYAHSGNFEAILNGKNYKFTVGDLVLIDSKEIHQINSLNEKGGLYTVLRFEPELVYNTMFENHLVFKYALPFILENSNHQKVIPSQIISTTFIPELLDEILMEFNNEDYGYEIAIKNHIGKIFLWILRYFHSSSRDKITPGEITNPNTKKLNPFFEYISDNFKADVKVEDLAKLCNMSFSYFSRTFNQIMGMNVNQYINYLRINEAAKLLVTSNKNITEISFDVGFNTTSYFIKQFKEYKKTTPKDFRKEYNMEELP
jgi:AraC-like DNA-binding protein/mannose-6-phosphate isomerase-like protein (cupin superfamily)